MVHKQVSKSNAIDIYNGIWRAIEDIQESRAVAGKNRAMPL